MPTSSIRQGEVRNVILAGLPPEEFAEMAPQLEPVMHATGDRLYYEEDRIRHVHFIESGLLSLLSTLEDGTAIEVGALGREGMGGLSLLLGSDTAAHTAMVQMAGKAYRMPTESAREAFRRFPAFQQKTLRYTRMLMSLISLTLACNTLHTVEERLARWLLMCRHRVGSDTLPLTQEFLSHMLGVRRSGVTVAVGIIQRAGLIKHSRGVITVVDAEGLREASCECIKAMSDEYDLFLAE